MKYSSASKKIVLDMKSSFAGKKIVFDIKSSFAGKKMIILTQSWIMNIASVMKKKTLARRKLNLCKYTHPST